MGKEQLSNTYKHAREELDILFKTTPDSLLKPFEAQILGLCEAFGKSGQSGGSAPYVAKLIAETVEKLCLQNPIAPLTGEESEWVNVDEHLPETYQNNREGAVFKDSEGVYFFHAIVWKGYDENYFTGQVDGITSRQYVRSFPFTPKTFYVDVVMKEGEWCIKDRKQLDEVFEYYKPL